MDYFFSVKFVGGFSVGSLIPRRNLKASIKYAQDVLLPKFIEFDDLCKCSVTSKMGEFVLVKK